MGAKGNCELFNETIQPRKSRGVPAQESQDAVRDAVFASAGTCTGDGVSLRL